ncbi:MAG: type II toxin-antitoxin system RelE/ParE family toxin [Thiohalorhabdaceae bacterium]
MAWAIELEAQAEKELAKLDRPVAQRILRFLRERVRPLEDPRLLAKPLKGLSELWSYRVGDYRLLCEIRDETLVVLVVRIWHRKEVYD